MSGDGPAEINTEMSTILQRMHADPDNASSILKDWSRTTINPGFKDVHFQGLSLIGFDFHDWYLENCTFSRCNLTDSKFNQATCNGVSFISSDLSMVELEKALLHKAAFTSCTFYKTSFRDAQLCEATFNSLFVVDGLSFRRADCALVTFKYAKLCGTDFANSKLVYATFDTCDLRGAIFSGSGLAKARFVSARFDHSTKLSGLESATDCEMSRYAIACLGPEYGGLTEGNRMDMKIVDHVAEMRLRFSGVFGLIHTLLSSHSSFRMRIFSLCNGERRFCFVRAITFTSSLP